TRRWAFCWSVSCLSSPLAHFPAHPVQQFLLHGRCTEIPPAPGRLPRGRLILASPLFHRLGKSPPPLRIILLYSRFAQHAIYPQPGRTFYRTCKLLNISPPRKSLDRRFRWEKIGSHRIEMHVIANRSQVTIATA